MAYTPKFYGEVVGGSLRLHGRDKFQKWLDGLNGKKVTLTVKRRTKSRSYSQNDYYWGVVVDLLASHMGYTPDEMHEALKWQFLRIERDLPTVRSTADLTTKEFMEYIEKIQVWAAEEFDVYIPDPNEYEADPT